jgi:hypothetical protein
MACDYPNTRLWVSGESGSSPRPHGLIKFEDRIIPKSLAKMRHFELVYKVLTGEAFWCGARPVAHQQVIADFSDRPIACFNRHSRRKGKAAQAVLASGRTWEPKIMAPRAVRRPALFSCSVTAL